MYDHVTTAELAAAIDELAGGLGVREDIELTLPSVLPKKDIPRWVETIAESLGLPVRVNVSFISSKSAKAGFGTTAMSRTDRWGRVSL